MLQHAYTPKHFTCMMSTIVSIKKLKCSENYRPIAILVGILGKVLDIILISQQHGILLFSSYHSVLVSSRLAFPISSQVTDHWGELCNGTGEVHPVEPFHSLDNSKTHFSSIVFVGIQQFTISGTEM